MRNSFAIIGAGLVLTFALATAQTVGAQEWLILSKDGALIAQSSDESLKKGPVTEKDRLTLNSMEANAPEGIMSGQDHLRLDDFQYREYNRQGSWAPLDTKTGEENFRLFSF